MQVTSKSRELYTRMFKARCAYMEPSCKLCVVDEKGNCFVSPYEETDDTFRDRLSRCEAAGCNLFFEEWKLFDIPEGVDQ